MSSPSILNYVVLVPAGDDVERLRRTDQLLAQAMAEKEQIVAELLHMSHSEYLHPGQVCVCVCVFAHSRG